MSQFNVTSTDTVHWLVEIAFAADVVRLSTVEVDITSDEGDLHFHGGLDEVEFIGKLVLGSTTADAPEISITGPWPVDVAALIAAGHELAWCPVTVSRWVEGTPYESRRVMLRGRVQNPHYGSAAEPVACTLTAAPWLETVLIPPASSQVTGANFLNSITSLDEEDLGKVYPRVYGTPGRVATSISSNGMIAGSRARWADLRTIAGSGGTYYLSAILADHHVTAQRVYAWKEDNLDAFRVWVTNTFDDAGHPVAVLNWYAASDPKGCPIWGDSILGYTFDYITNPDFDGSPTYGLGHATTHFDESTAAIYVAWIDDEDTGRGGLEVNGDTIRSAGDVIADLLRQSGIPVDNGRMAAAARLLRNFRLDFSIDARCKPWEFIQSNILPLLPVSVIQGPEGLYLAVWRYDATDADAVYHLDADADPRVSRVGPIEESTDELANEFTLRFAKSMRTGTFEGSVRLTGSGTWSSGDPTVLPDARCIASRRRYRALDGSEYVAEKTLDTICVYDLATAWLIVDTWAAAYTRVRRSIEYDLDEAAYWRVEPGTVVTITDSTVSLGRAVAQVEQVRLGVDGVQRVRLFLLPPRST